MARAMGGGAVQGVVRSDEWYSAVSGAVRRVVQCDGAVQCEGCSARG